MATTVKQLVTEASNNPSVQSAKYLLLAGQKVRHRFIEDGEVMQYIGQVVSQVIIIVVNPVLDNKIFKLLNPLPHNPYF